MPTKTRSISLYLSEAEYNTLKTEAEEYDLTISTYIRALLKLPQDKRGAPIGNSNRTGKKLKGGNKDI